MLGYEESTIVSESSIFMLFAPKVKIEEVMKNEKNIIHKITLCWQKIF